MNYIWPFPLLVSCSPSQLDRLGWRPMAYFCRTKQPTKENSWLLASLDILLLGNTYPPKKKLFFFNRESNSLPTTADWEVWGSVQSFDEPVQHCSCSYSVFPSCLSPMVQCSKNLNFGSSKPAEENKRELFPFYELFVLGDSTVCTTLVALPCDSVLRSTSPPSFGRNVFCLWFYSSCSHSLALMCKNI